MISKHAKLFMTVLTLCVASGVGANAAQRNVGAATNAAVARSTTTRPQTTSRTTVARATTKIAPAARTSASRTTAARTAVNVVQSRSNAGGDIGPQKSVSKRATTATHGLVARAGGTNQVVGTSKSTSAGEKLSVVNMYVDSDISGKYENLKKYVELSSGKNGKYVKLLKYNNKLPDLSGLVRNLGSYDVVLEGIYTTNTVDDSAMVYDDSGALNAQTSNIDENTELHMLPWTTDTNIDVPDGCYDYKDSVDAFNNMSANNGWGITFKAKKIIKDSKNSDDCRLIVQDNHGLCYTNSGNAGWNSGQYGDPAILVKCDATSFGMVGTNSWNASINFNGGVLFQSSAPLYRTQVVVHVASGDTLPSLTKIVQNMTPPQSGYKLQGIFRNQDCTGDPVYDANGNPLLETINSADDMPNLGNNGRLSFWYMCWQKPAQGTTCPAAQLQEGEEVVRYVRAKATENQKTDKTDCAAIVNDKDGFCRMAHWDGHEYKLISLSPVVNCEKQNSDLDGTVTIDVDADIDTQYSNLTFESFDVGIEFGQPLPSLEPLINNRKNKAITLTGVYKTKSMANGVQSGTGQIWGADGAPAVTSVSNMNSFAYSDYQNMYFAYAVWDKGAATVENTCSNKLSDYPGYMTGDTFIKAVQTTNQSSLSGIEDCAAIVHDSIGLCWALKMNNSARQLIPCADEINTYNLGYGMVRMNQFPPSGYNPDTYESSSTYYFLPWAYNNPVSLMDTNNGYTMVFRFRTTVGSSYGKDENGNTGMLQLPDLTKYVNNLTPPAGKKFAGIYSMWGKDVTETDHIYGTAGGDFTFTSTKLYDETGKAIKQYIKLDDLPWTYPRLADTGGRPFFMFIIWDDVEPQGDDSCPVFDKSVQGSAWNSITPTKYVRAKNAADRKSDKTDCAIIYEDADGFCRIAPYIVQPASQGLPAISVYTSGIYKGDGKWNISSPRDGPVVDCDKEYSDIDEELLVLTNAGGIKSNYDDRQSLLFNQLYVGIEYGKKLPSLALLVNMNKYYLPNAVLVGGFGKNNQKYWDADGEPVKTIASETELKNNFDGHDGLYEPSLLWNTANVTVADCPVPDGLSCADENEACDLSERKTYPIWWMPKNAGTLSYVRSEFLFNGYGAIADCGVILKDENGTCWAVRNYRSCTAGETTCAPKQVECGE